MIPLALSSYVGINIILKCVYDFCDLYNSIHDYFALFPKSSAGRLAQFGKDWVLAAFGSYVNPSHFSIQCLVELKSKPNIKIGHVFPLPKYIWVASGSFVCGERVRQEHNQEST